MTYAAFILAFITLLTCAILLIVQPIQLLSRTSVGWNIFLAVVLILISILLLVFLFCYKQ